MYSNRIAQDGIVLKLFFAFLLGGCMQDACILPVQGTASWVRCGCLSTLRMNVGSLIILQHDTEAVNQRTS
jgi:hypothetical protein